MLMLLLRPLLDTLSGVCTCPFPLTATLSFASPISKPASRFSNFGVTGVEEVISRIGNGSAGGVGYSVVLTMELSRHCRSLSKLLPGLSSVTSSRELVASLRLSLTKPPTLESCMINSDIKEMTSFSGSPSFLRSCLIPSFLKRMIIVSI